MGHQHSHDHHHHGHSHGHHHHEHRLPSNITRAFAIGVALNLLFVVIEALYAWHANSTSLLADAGHNLGDVAGLAFAWLANTLVTKASSARYTYGYKRTTIVAALLNAVLLLVSSILIAFEAFQVLMHPEPVKEMIVIIVAAVGILVNGTSAFLFHGDHEDDLNIKAAFLHLLYDAVLSAGVVVTGLIIKFTHWYRLDPIVALVIVCFIVSSTWHVLRDSVDLMLDAVPRKINLEKVKECLCRIDGVSGVHHVHVWGLSTSEIALTAHLVVPEGGFKDSDYARVNKILKDKFKIVHTTLQIESGEKAADEGCCDDHHCT